MPPDEDAGTVRASGEKVVSLQYLRGLAALMVVLFHVGALVGSEKYHGNLTIGWLTGGLKIGVDLFFVLSGFVISMPLLMGRKVPSPATFLANRALRIYPLVVVTALLYAVSGALVLHQPLLGHLDVLVTSALLLPYTEQPVPIVLWTLRQEVLFYLLFTLALLDRRLGLAVLAAWGVASFVIGSDHWLWGVVFHPQNIEFLFGIATCALCARLRPGATLANAAFLAAGALLLVYAVTLANDPAFVALGWQPIIAGLLSAALLGAAYFSTVDLGRGILLLGQASFSIYLVHYFFISSSNKVLFGLRNVLPDAVSTLLMFAIAVAGGVAFHLLLERPLEEARKRLRRGAPPAGSPRQVPAE